MYFVLSKSEGCQVVAGCCKLESRDNEVHITAVSSKSTLSKLDYLQRNDAFLWDLLSYSRSPQFIGFWVLPTFSYLAPAVLNEGTEKSELHWCRVALKGQSCTYSCSLGPLKFLNLPNCDFSQWNQLLWHFTNHQEHIYIKYMSGFFPNRSA